MDANASLLVGCFQNLYSFKTRPRTKHKENTFTPSIWLNTISILIAAATNVKSIFQLNSMPKIIFIFLLVLIVTSGSCSKVKLGNVIGSYKYVYPFGDIEIIKLHSDGSLEQTFFREETQIGVESPYLSNRGKWTLRGLALEFENVYFISSWPNRSSRRIPPELMTFWTGCHFDRVDNMLVIRFTDEDRDYYAKL